MTGLTATAGEAGEAGRGDAAKAGTIASGAGLGSTGVIAPLVLDGPMTGAAFRA